VIGFLYRENHMADSLEIT